MVRVIILKRMMWRPSSTVNCWCPTPRVTRVGRGRPNPWSVVRYFDQSSQVAGRNVDDRRWCREVDDGPVMQSATCRACVWVVNCPLELILHPSPGPHSTTWDVSVTLVTCSERAFTGQLVASLLLSRLDNCNVILVGLPDVLNFLFWILLLAWCSAKKHIDYKLCHLAHQALTGTTPRFIRELLQQVADFELILKPPSFGFKWWPCRSANQVENWRTSISVGSSGGMENDPTRFKRELKTPVFSKNF